MKEFWASVRKEFLHIFRDMRTVLIVMVMPVMQIILFGFAVSTEVTRARIAFCGDISDPLVRSTIDRIGSNRYLETAGMLDSPSGIADLFMKDRADAAVCFERDFGSRLISSGKARIKIIGDGSDPNTARIITSYVSGVLQQEQYDISVSMTGERKTSMTPSVQLMYNPAMKSSYNFVPGVMGLIIILICAMMTSVSIVREKETGTMELLLVSPTKPIVVIMAKMVPYFVVSMVNYLTILALSVWLLHIPISGSFWALTLLSVIYIVLSLALGQLISTIAKTQVSAMLMSGFMLLVPVLFFSELLFPVDSMPLVFRWFSDLIPARWYVIGVKKIMIEGLPMFYAAREFIILSVMAAVILGVSLMRYKNRM